jgi:ferrochelatase
MRCDAVLVVSFGGPEAEADVLPFLENVLRGRNVPRQRMLEVAEHYYHFGGKSPINDQNRLLIAKLREELAANGPNIPVYWGNRNWHPLLTDTVAQMTKDGVRNALAFVTSAYSSYSGCRQYREDIERARQAAGPDAPQIAKLRAFFNHPGFIEPMTENLRAAMAGMSEPLVIFTAHSIPTATARTSRYAEQIEEASRLVAEGAGAADWQLAWQSRSGPPGQPWLEPDIGDVLRTTTAREVVVAPIGFVSDHMEVLYDLDEEARAIADERGIVMQRAATVGAHPRFVTMIRELVVERINAERINAERINAERVNAERVNEGVPRLALGRFGANPDVCPIDCCPAPVRIQTREIPPA